MPRTSRSRVDGRYQNLATSTADYGAAFERLYQELAQSPMYKGAQDRARLRAVLDGLPKDYKGFRFAIVAALEQAPAFIGTAASFSAEHDQGGDERPVIGFGFDFAYQRGHFVERLGAAGIALTPQVRAILERFDARDSRVTSEQLLTQLNGAGFSITRAEAVQLFQVTADSLNYEGEVTRIFEGIPQSVERAVLLSAVFNGITTAPFNKAVKAGRFEEAYVILAFTTEVNQSRNERPMINAAVLGRVAAGETPYLSLTSALDYVDALERWRSSIDTKRASLPADLVGDFDGQMNALKQQIDEVTRNNGIFVSYSGNDSLASIAQQTQTPLSWLSTVYSNGPGRYQSVFLPKTVPYNITDTFTPSDTPAGTSHIIADANGSFYSFAVENTERPRSTFIMDKFGRPVGSFDAGPGTPTFSISRGVDGSVTFEMPNGSTIRYLSKDGVDHPVEIVFTRPNGTTVERSGDAFFVVTGDGTFTVTQRIRKSEFTHLDLLGVEGIAELLQIPGLGGRVADAGSGTPFYPTEGLVDADGPVDSRVSIAADGTKTVFLSFHLEDHGAGYGDAVTQILTYRPGQTFASEQTITRVGKDATVMERRVNSSSAAMNFGRIDPEVSIEYPDQLITFEQFGGIFGSALGKQLAGRSVAAQIGLGALLGTVTANLGEIADNFMNNPSTANGQGKFSSSQKIDEALHNLPEDLLAQLKSAGIGALSSFLTAELFDALGVDGTIGELGQSVSGAYVSAIIEALPALINGTKSISQVLGTVNIANVAGSFIGSKLASQVVTFDTVGGQLGAAVGSAVGSLVGGKLIGQLLGSALGGPLGTLVGAVIGSFVGQLLGGLIGSIFGGTPRSGADVQWDASRGEFVVGNVYARKGGSKETATQLASAVAASYNSVLRASGATLLNAAAVQAGNYGMRKSEFVYRAVSTTDANAISARFTGKDGSASLITHGAYLGLSSMIGQMAAGDTVVKRAILANLSNAHGNPAANQVGSKGDFSVEALTGDIAVAQDYSLFLDDPERILAMIAAQPNSSFTAGWTVTLQRARELGLHRRASTDWTGGFSVWLDVVLDEVVGGATVAASNVGIVLNNASGERNWIIYDADGKILTTAYDEIETSAQTQIEATAGNDTISLSGTQILATSGAINATLVVNGKAHNGTAVEVDLAASIDAGDGDDIVQASDRGDNVMGGGGNDTLYGGRLDDWLLGGDGDDVLDAGTVDQGALGGDGNYLSGGAGNDTIKGREGSDWLEGGDGTDALTGGAGDDILAGGAGDNDDLKGGLGSDQYLVRQGDGADIVEEEAGGAPAAQAGSGDYVSQRMAGLLAGTIKKNWIGNAPGVSSRAIAGGEDAIVFGAGIGMGDIVLVRSGTDADDLLIRVMKTENGAQVFSGTQLTVKDWFANSFKRVEWLKFTDGTEIRIGDITSFIIGGDGNDVLIGTEGNDFVYGGAGNDAILLFGGDDIGNGGAGNDMVAGHEGKDLLIGGLGVDQLIGGKDKDVLSGDGGGDDLYGGEADDILSGGRGDGDVVVGGAGNDTFKYSRGDGRDVILDEYAGSWDVIWTVSGQWNEAAGYTYVENTGEVIGPGGVYLRKNVGTADKPDLQWLGQFDYDRQSATLRYFKPAADTIATNSGTDTIELAPGINIQDVVLSRSADGKDLVLGIGQENAEFASAASLTDSITLKDWYAAPGQIEKLAFYQTGVLDISATNLVTGTDLADGTTAAPLAGTSIADWVTGGAGDDVVAAGGGDDILAGNSGSDLLKGEIGDDVLYGGTGNDLLDGGAGKDVLIGGVGLDTASYASSGSAVRAHLSAAFANSGDAAGDEYSGIENLLGGGGNDLLGGDDGDNELTGGQGNDMLLGGEGDDTYVWNVSDGADVVDDSSFVVQEAVTAAGALADGFTATWESTGELQPGFFDRYYWRLRITDPLGQLVYDSALFAPTSAAAPQPAPAAYIQSGWLGGFSRTNGQQVTREKIDASVNAGNDVLEMGPGISLADLSFSTSGNDLIVRYGASAASQVTIRNHFTANSRIETLQFRDGLSVSLASILTASSGALLTGTANDDLLVGQDGALADQLDGGAGHDVLSGGGGNDTLAGGAGDDVIEGGAGADMIDGGIHSATTEAGWGDTARYVRSTAAVRVDLRNTTTGQTGGDAAGDILTGIENLTGSAFGDTLTGDDGANRIDGLDGSNVIYGNGGDDVLIGGSGLDRLYGDDGDDAIAGGAGNDSLYGGAGNDRLDGSEGSDSLDGGDGNDTLTGGDGGGSYYGGEGDDVIVGGSGNDWVDAGAGNDSMTAGAGTDTLSGGDGDDIYIFEAGFGNDTVIDFTGRNKIVIGGSVSFEQLWFTRAGNNFQIGMVGTSDRITLQNYFASSWPTVMHSVSTATHTLFLDHAAPLISAMTAIQTTTPQAMPDAIKAQLAGYWHAGGKAKPAASAIALNISEDNPTASIAAGVVDHDDNIVGYELQTQAANGTVSLNAATGQFVYTPNADFNGEDAFTVLAKDADGQAVAVSVKVTVGAVNDAPDSLATGPLAIAEFAADGTEIGTFSANDVDDAAGTLVFDLLDNAGGRFRITNDGRLLVNRTPQQVATGQVLDFEAVQNHTIRVRVTDPAGLSSDRLFTVAVADSNEAPIDIVAPALGIAENVSGSTPIAVLTGLDPDGATDPLIFSLDDSAGGRFEITQAGELRLAAGVALDYENAISHMIVVRATDRGGLAVTRSFTVNVANVNEAPTDIWADRTLAFQENLAVGTSLAQFSGADPENNITSFVLTNDAGGRFALQPDGQLTVGAAGLDYEAGATHTIGVRVTDAGGLTREESFTISLVNVNEAPSDIVAPTLSVNENAANGTPIGTLTAADPDTPATGLTFTLDDSAGGRFTISADGKLTVASGAALNYEAAASHAITVRVTDSGGLTRVEDFVVGVANVNEAPTGLTLTATGATVTERDRIGDDPTPLAILLGTLAGIDPDLPTSGTDAVLAYSVTDPRFEIRNGNELWLKAGTMADLDYETNPNVSVNVTVKDRAGGAGALSFTRSFTFALTDRDDILIGTSESDVLPGQSGRDILRGLGGNDALFGASGNDDLYGGDGLDTLNGEDGDDRLYGELGNDGLSGGIGADLLDGGDGNDTLAGGDGGDTLQGGGGLDTLDGGTGNDLLYGGGDGDTLTGGAGTDRLEGGSGDDNLAGGADADRFLGGEGVDTITYASAGAAITVNLAAGTGSAGEAQGDVFEDAPEILIGSAYGDQITGTAQRDILYGGAGNDTIYGGSGDDEIFGGDGNDFIDAQGGGDTLDGGTGMDVLIGGTGNDVYLINVASGADEIRNFDPNGTDIDVIGYQDIGRDRLWFERSGNNLVITVVGTSTVTTVKDYFVTATPGDLSNFKIDFIVAGQHFAHEINVDGLTSLMAGYSKPADTAAYATLHGNLVFENQWKNYWDENGAPVLSDVGTQTIAEDAYNAAPLTVTIRATDDITPVTGINVTAVAVNPDNPAVADNSIIQSVTVGAANGSGDHVLSIRTNPNASGSAMIKVTAIDPGGIATQKLFLVNVTPGADAPVITSVTVATPVAPLTKPTLDSGSWTLNVQAALTDQDGSETLEVRISGLPTGLSFDRGTNLGSGTWTFTPAQLSGLRLLGPASWAQDLALTVTAIARESATGQTASTSTTLNVVLNARPSDLVPDRAVEANENAAAGTAVANFATTDGDTGDTRTYSLLNNAGGRFQINASTGAVTVATGAVLDYEAAGGTSHTIRIQVQDSGGLTYAEDVTVAVRNVNEAPTDIWEDRTLSFYENIAVGAGIAWFGGADPENNITSYSLLYSAGDRFALRSDGLLMVGAAGLNSEAGASQSILVRATDAGGLVRDEWFTVTIADVNENPTDISADRTLAFNENIAVGTGLAWFGGTDPESNISSYSLVNDAGGRFLVSSTGLLMVGSAGLNYEAGASQTIVVRATDAGGLIYDESFTITIGNVNENPTDIWEDRTLLFNENYGVGTGLAWFGGSDPEGNIASYSLLDSAGGRFALDANGLLKVGSAGLNYEAGASQSILVRATDTGGLVRDEWFTVTIGNVNETPTDIWEDRTLSFSENIGVGTGLAWFGGSDPEANITTYSLLNDAGGRFSLSSGGLLMVGSTGLNYEAGASHSILVRATDAGGLVRDEWFTVTIGNVNEAPTDIWEDRALSFSENIGVGTGLAWFGSSDPDGNIASYSLLDSAGDRFALRSDGLLMVGGAGLNYEAGSNHSLLVRTTDAGGLVRDEWFAVTIGNVNEAHTLAPASFSLAENVFGGPTASVANLLPMLSDPENASMSWSFADGSYSQGNFKIDPLTGQINLNGPFDYESLTSVYEWQDVWVQDPYDPYGGGYYEQQYVYMGRDPSLATFNLSITASDGTHSVTSTATINVTDVNEGPVFGYTPRFIVRDDQSNGYLGQLYGYDPDTGGAAVSYSISLGSFEEQFISYGGSSDIDNYANPNVSVVWNTGRLSFSTPGDGEWEGGIRNHPVYGTRMSYQLVYRMQATMSDASGVTNTQPFEIIFLKHGQSSVLPLILDLDGDGVEMVEADPSGVRFDMNEDGLADQTGWVGADDGLLVLDRNGNGIIDDAGELSFARDDEQAVTDLEGLRAWDSNRNGFLEAGDTDFGRFQIWRDVNQNGISEAGELFSLSSLGIRSLSLTLNLTNQELVSDRNVLFATSEFQRTDGTTGLIGDVSFAFDPEEPAEEGPAEGVAPPIVLDLDGDNAGLVSLTDSKTRFDMNGDGVADKTGWIEAGDALLALDRNGNGAIDGIDEISFVKDKAGAKTDLEGLAAFDSNADGKLDGADTRFVEFRAWRDANANGLTDAGELLSLAEAGVVSISLTGTATGEAETAGSNIVYNKGSFTRASGASGTLLDVGLAFKAMPKLPEIEFQDSDWNGKARSYTVTGGATAARVTPRHAKGILSADSGQIAPAAMLSFSDRTIGLLSTILVDLDGDGLEARRASRSRAAFDMDVDGVADNTGWVSGGDGLLVIDRDGSGSITHASELSFLSEKDGATSAWDGLSVLDNTRDGKIDAKDARFGELKVWADRNGDGVSQTGEVKSLAELGITEIGLRSVSSGESARIGDNLPLSTATFKWANGVTATIGNVAMAFDPSSAKPEVGGTPTSLPANTPDENAAALAASRLVQAMNGFGAGMSEGSLSARWTEPHFGIDMLAARVA